jgi:putative endonuclease
VEERVKYQMRYYVYILASDRNGTLYIGSTSDLTKRVWQHKNKVVEGFTKKYGVDKLVHYEIAENQETAAERERQLKKWNRAWKIRLIEEENPAWEDFYEKIIN